MFDLFNGWQTDEIFRVFWLALHVVLVLGGAFALSRVDIRRDKARDLLDRRTK